MRSVHPDGVHPTSVTTDLTLESYYNLAQGRSLTCWELWAIARGHDLRGIDVNVSKLHGAYSPSEVIGPDPFYKCQLLKDSSKANKTGKNELVGATRHKDPEFCACNATSNMLLLRFGKHGIVGQLPSHFDIHCMWSTEESLFTNSNATAPMSYEEQARLFRDMKTASGLHLLMGDCATKLRSFGAMHANENQASHPEINRAGR